MKELLTEWRKYLIEIGPGQGPMVPVLQEAVVKFMDWENVYDQIKWTFEINEEKIEAVSTGSVNVDDLVGGQGMARALGGSC